MVHEGPVAAAVVEVRLRRAQPDAPQPAQERPIKKSAQVQFAVVKRVIVVIMFQVHRFAGVDAGAVGASPNGEGLVPESADVAPHPSRFDLILGGDGRGA